MDKQRKKELLEQYRQMRPEMGAFVFHCKGNGKNYLCVDKDIRGTINSIRFQLWANSFRLNAGLQKDWNEYGEDQFDIEIVEQLNYDEKAPDKTDYSEELKILAEIWLEKLDNVQLAKPMRRK